MTIEKAVLELTNGTGKMLTANVSGLAGNLHTECEVYQQYGIASHPANITGETASECIMAKTTSKVPVIIATEDRRYRPATTQGQVVLYTSTPGQKITLTPGGNIVLENASSSITLDNSGNITLNGNVTVVGSLKHGGKFIDSTHTHSGVTTGSGVTGTPV